MRTIHSDEVIVDIGGNMDNRYGYNFKNKELFIKSNKKTTGMKHSAEVLEERWLSFTHNKEELL